MSENAKKNCPAGNSGKWANNQWVPDPNRVILFDVKSKNKNNKGKVNDSRIRNKKSDYGKLAVEHLTIDRVRKIKNHLVEEQDEKGNWNVVHLETDKPI